MLGLRFYLFIFIINSSSILNNNENKNIIQLENQEIILIIIDGQFKSIKDQVNCLDNLTIYHTEREREEVNQKTESRKWFNFNQLWT